MFKLGFILILAVIWNGNVADGAYCSGKVTVKLILTQLNYAGFNEMIKFESLTRMPSRTCSLY